MLHHVARALPGLRLFHDAHEAAHLWSCLTRRLAPIEALVLMPDHLHLIAVVDLRPPLAQVLSGHARWLNARRGTRGAWVRPLPPAEALVDDQKVRRSIRYVHLNPCRARLAADPLAWPWSTYRDRVDLALFPVVKAHPRPASLHAYTSGDPSVHVAGTELPARCHATPGPIDVLHAVSALARRPLADLSRRGSARSAYLAVARALCDAPHRAIGELVGVGRDRVRGRDPRAERLVQAVLGDPRFPPL